MRQLSQCYLDLRSNDGYYADARGSQVYERGLSWKRSSGLADYPTLSGCDLDRRLPRGALRGIGLPITAVAKPTNLQKLTTQRCVCGCGRVATSRTRCVQSISGTSFQSWRRTSASQSCRSSAAVRARPASKTASATSRARACALLKQRSLPLSLLCPFPKCLGWLRLATDGRARGVSCLPLEQVCGVYLQRLADPSMQLRNERRGHIAGRSVRVKIHSLLGQHKKRKNNAVLSRHAQDSSGTASSFTRI